MMVDVVAELVYALRVGRPDCDQFGQPYFDLRS